MKIKNKQTLNLMRKILCSRQLFHHSNLCKTYVELVKLSAENSNKITPEDSTRAQKKYTKKLASAAKGNLDFLYNSKEDITKGIFSDSHTKKEIELFKSYQYHSLKLLQYKTADSFLQDAIINESGNDIISDSALKKYYDFMHQDLKIENPNHPEAPNIKNLTNYSCNYLLEKDVTIHTPKWLGAKFCIESRCSLNTIKNIDSNYLPENFSIEQTFSPKSFGATITGFTNNYSKNNFTRKL